MIFDPPMGGWGDPRPKPGCNTGCIVVYGVLCLLILTQKTKAKFYEKCMILQRRDAALI